MLVVNKKVKNVRTCTVEVSTTQFNLVQLWLQNLVENRDRVHHSAAAQDCVATTSVGNNGPALLHLHVCCESRVTLVLLHTFLYCRSSHVSFQWSPAALNERLLALCQFKEWGSGISVRCTLSNVYLNLTTD